MEQADVTPPKHRSWPRRLLNRMEVDRAVFYVLSARGWQLLAGPVTMLLITLHFTLAVQGYFYLFASLMALQTFVELGLQTIIINVASHEWSRLRLDEQGFVTGDATALSRLVSLGRFSFAWYAVVAFLFIIGAGVAGAILFSQNPNPQVEWEAPWIGLLILTGLLLWTLPFTAILEGCQQVATVNRFRVIQAVTGNLVVWACIVLGGNLWAVVASVGVRLFWELYLLCVTYRRFFRPFWAKPTHSRISWWTEIWPLQWTLAIQGVVSYFAYHLFIPTMFYFHGAGVTAQMGMTWTILTALEAAAFAWVQTRTPLFGILISKKAFRELDRVFLRLTAISLFVLIVGGVAFCSAVSVLNALPIPLAPKLAARLLPLLPTIALTMGVILMHVPRCQSIYILAHKRNPLLALSISTSAAIGVSVWLLGMKFGPLGAGLGYAGVVALLNVPGWSWLWLRCRSRWHHTEA